MNLKNKFAQKLKQVRKKRGITQEKLAELVEVAPRHISFIETARSFPSCDLLERICRCLDVKCSELFDFEEEIERDELIRGITATINRLDDEKLKYIYKIANLL